MILQSLKRWNRCQNKLAHSETVSVPYLIVVSESGNGDFVIIQSDFFNLHQFDMTKIRHVTSLDDALYLKQIVPLINSQLDDKHKSYTQFTQADIYQPYYIISFSKPQSNNTISIKLTYNLVTQQIVITQFTENIQVVQTVQQKVTVPYYEFRMWRIRMGWRQIDYDTDVDTDVFNTYFLLSSTSTKFLQILIQKSFQTQQSILNYKRILRIEQKSSNDGIYYKLTLQSQTNAYYDIKLYWHPQTNYMQILKYQIINSVNSTNNGYQESKQVRVRELLDDKYYGAAMKIVESSYQSVLKDAKVIFLAYVIKDDDRRYYRMMFLGNNGKCQGIVAVDKEYKSVIMKWHKLDEGYFWFKWVDFQNEEYFKSLVSFTKVYLSKKLNNYDGLQDMSYKEVPTGKYFKFVYQKPFPFVISLFHSTVTNKVSLSGLQLLKPIYKNKYYNNRLFNSLTQLPPSSLSTSLDTAPLISSLFLSTDIIKADNYQILAVYRQVQALGKYYKIIFKIIGSNKMYLVVFWHDFVKDVYKVINMEEYAVVMEPGDYGWMCVKREGDGACLGCQSGEYGVVWGRCYQKIEGCSLQIGTNCKFCQNKLTKIGTACQPLQILTAKQPPKVILKLPQVSAGTETASVQTSASSTSVPSSTATRATATVTPSTLITVDVPTSTPASVTVSTAVSAAPAPVPTPTVSIHQTRIKSTSACQYFLDSQCTSCSYLSLLHIQWHLRKG